MRSQGLARKVQARQSAGGKYAIPRARPGIRARVVEIGYKSHVGRRGGLWSKRIEGKKSKKDVTAEKGSLEGHTNVGKLLRGVSLTVSPPGFGRVNEWRQHQPPTPPTPQQLRYVASSVRTREHGHPARSNNTT